MKQAEADLHDERLREALATLNWLADSEDYFRACHVYRDKVAELLTTLRNAEADATDAA